MYLLIAGWELITQSPQAGNWNFSQRHSESAEQLFFSQQEKKMEKRFQNRLRIMFLCSILNLANNCCWVPLALKRIINSKEFDAAVCEYKFSILLIILHSLLFYYSIFYISVQILCEITYSKFSITPPREAYLFQAHLSRRKVISDGGLKSEILNSQFSSVFTKEDLQNIPDMGSDPTPGLGSFIISEQGVLKQLSSSNPNMACGPENSTMVSQNFCCRHCSNTN